MWLSYLDLKTQIVQIDDETETLKQSKDSSIVDFMQFALETVENMRRTFWELDEEHLTRYKQLIFPRGFSLSPDKKVYTPEISEFYRLALKQKDLETSSKSDMVGDIGFEPITSTTSMWRSSQMS